MIGANFAREICRTAKERKAGSLGYAEAMLIAYNQKMKNGLKWSKLYSNKGYVLDDIDTDDGDDGDDGQEMIDFL